MPVRMPETHRVRGWRRVLVLIANVNYFGTLTCHGCHKHIENEYPTIDHVECRSSGCDPKDINNTIVLCNSCNGRKCNRSVEETFGIEKRVEIEQYMATRLFSPDDLVKAREINKAFTKTADVLAAIALDAKSSAVVI